MGRRVNGKLTQKEENFCRKYFECGNASEAYRYAYNCGKMKQSTIGRNAYQLLRNNYIAAKLQYYKDHLEEALGLSKQKVLAEHKKIAFSDATRIRDGWMSLKDFNALTDEERACIKSIKSTRRKTVAQNGETVIDEQVYIVTYDKQKALDSISEMLGYNEPKKVQGDMLLHGISVTVEDVEQKQKLDNISNIGV